MSMYDDDDDEDLTPEEREFARLVNESLNLFVLPAPPEHLTPRMAQIALQRLIQLDQVLGQETMRVMLGVHQLDPALGEQIVGLIPKYFGAYQDEIKAISDKLEGMAQDLEARRRKTQKLQQRQQQREEGGQDTLF